MNIIPGQKIYLDANIFIYAIEGFRQFHSQIFNIFNMIDSNDISAVTSELTLSECLVKPYKENRKDIAKVYNDFIKSTDSLFIKEIKRFILINAAKIRASEKALKLPDAIHIATAISEDCSYFLTNDKRIKSNDIQIVYLDSLN